MKILHIVGARPNFMKIAPLMRAMSARASCFDQKLVHTGQHYDRNMSDLFFEQLGMPPPDVNLDVGSGSHAMQTATIMERFEPIAVRERPDWTVVVGDVNSTMACTLVCAKLGLRVAHVEAGLRSFDRAMPEEINRLVTDQLADLLLTPSPDADVNLRREGIPDARIRRVGNIMIDTLVRLLPAAREAGAALLARFGLNSGSRIEPYLLVTLHRPSNVDHEETARELLQALEELSERLPVLFPIHPRTSARLRALGLAPGNQVRLLDPVGYLEFLGLQAAAALVLTDSGGVQEETTYLGVPCLTARPNTERPVTITHGSNELVETRAGAIVAAAHRRLEERLTGAMAETRRCPPLWDGHAAERICDALCPES